MVLFIVLSLPMFLFANELSKDYKITIGEILELQCNIRSELYSFNFKRSLSFTDGMIQKKVLVTYNKKDEKLELIYYGERKSVDNAQKILGLIKENFIPKIINFAKKRYDVVLEIDHFRSFYISKKQNITVLQMENGEFVFPKNE